MLVFPLLNENAHVISATGTAASLLSLIDTAGDVRHSFKANLDAVDITPEDGDIRVNFVGASPTASKGFLLKEGSVLFLRHTPLKNIKIISTSGTVSCSLQIGTSEEEEKTNLS